ncbi:GPI inositol-deacylase [Anticarsia gemmatalis]|uniref:GPI inositol-deacylase n=1 Tax=Anticarsia gemmatalis TaxID=129554 RepID=UPI003F767759
MRFLDIIRSSLFQIISFIFVLGYLLGFLNVHFSDKNNYCLMTYMFEYPQFVRLTVPENKIYPQYGLYAYSEGRFTERARKMWFDGVPVLFLPGNSGSHMQARSLASVALRKALSRGYQYHFDFFTISYNEELSGLYGGVLQSQTKFAAACISKILRLYKSNKYTKVIPSSVILIGHSMGGLIAKRLLAYPSTINSTSVAITLAAPLEAPVINVDAAMDDYYMLMNLEWDTYVNSNMDIKQKKMLFSFGNGPRDILMPSGLTSSNDSYISALTTAIPGVWASPDHVCIVWCKQLVMVINRFLFSIVDPVTEQITENQDLLMSRAKQYFQANRSMTLSPDVVRPNLTMVADAFWYEDNRRIYQVSRPQIDKTTYLMIRLVGFPQNRFVAVEAVNVDDKEWIFGCNAKFTYNTYRYCKQATPLSELSRWTGAAADFGRRKLATIHLHNIKEQHPDWSHVIVRVSPTRKPIVLNVDINDHASREIFVNVPSDFSFGKTIIRQETEQESLYYELILKDFNMLYQAYLLYVEPTASCKAIQYHVSAEMHVPWAANHEYFHYFTQAKRTPMKLRLFKSNPNITNGLEATEHVKITLLLDPQCTYTISISTSWYHRLAQLARNYSPVLVPYVAAIVLLAARSNLLHLQEHGTCVSIHSALCSEGVKPYYALVFGRLAATVLVTIPALSFLFENASWRNLELQYFIKSLLVVPAYMTALGIVNITAAAVLAVMVFSSQIAHRLFFRIMWRGSSSLAEKMASGLQKVPMVVTGALLFGAPLSCGAAALVAGAAFYAFMLSKMYEEYLEDYVYKLMAKVAARVCRMFKSKKTQEAETSLVKAGSSTELSSQKDNEEIKSTNDKNVKSIEGSKDNKIVPVDDLKNEKKENTDCNKLVPVENNTEVKEVTSEKPRGRKNSRKRNSQGADSDVDEDLNNLNFHMMMFFMWVVVTLVNVPALLTWARNFSYSMVLKPDTSYHTGLVMSACSAYIWQLDGPRRNLKHYDVVTALLFTMAVFILTLGPLSLTVVSYGVTFMFAVITVQQMLDTELIENVPQSNETNSSEKEKEESEEKQEETSASEFNDKSGKDKAQAENTEETPTSSDDCNVCSESRIYRIFSNLREKFSFSENL